MYLCSSRAQKDGLQRRLGGLQGGNALTGAVGCVTLRREGRHVAG
jgi:hypothetical protein